MSDNNLLSSKRSNSRPDFVIKDNILSKSKRSQSNIIVAVLLILIVLAAIAIIWLVAKGFVKPSQEICLF